MRSMGARVKTGRLVLRRSGFRPKLRLMGIGVGRGGSMDMSLLQRRGGVKDGLM